MLSRTELMGNWNGIVGSIREKFGEFTNDELAKVEGNYEQLVGLIQRKSGQTQESIASFLSDCSESASTTYGQVANRTAQYADAAGEMIRDNYDRVSQEAKKALPTPPRALGADRWNRSRWQSAQESSLESS